MKSQVRCFIAVEIASQVRSEIDRFLRRQAAGLESVKWVTPDQFHLTLKFLGDVPMNEIHHVIGAIERSCRGFEPFDLVFEKVGAFPDVTRPRTLWAGVTEDPIPDPRVPTSRRDGGQGQNGTESSDALPEIEPSRLLAERIDAELAQLGYPREIRRFTPHLTLGRVKNGRDDFDRHAGHRDDRRFDFRRDDRRDDRRFDRRGRGDRFGAPPAEGAPAAGAPKETGAQTERITQFLTENADSFFGVSTVDGVTLFSSELSRSGPKYDVLAEIDFKPEWTEKTE